MMRSRQFFGAAVLLALATVLSSCSPISLAPAGSFQIGKGASTVLDRDWNDISALMSDQTRTVRLLSINGPLLNRLYLSDGLSDGQALVRPVRSREATTPVFRIDMGFSEQVEFVSDSVAALGYERVATEAIRPIEVSGQRGVRFGITAATKAGLDIKGLAQAVVKDDRLYVVLYLAPAEHYFDASRSNAETAMDSLVI